jgi:uncharacterized membrane protein
LKIQNQFNIFPGETSNADKSVIAFFSEVKIESKTYYYPQNTDKSGLFLTKTFKAKISTSKSSEYNVNCKVTVLWISKLQIYDLTLLNIYTIKPMRYSRWNRKDIISSPVKLKSSVNFDTIQNFQIKTTLHGAGCY